MFETMQAHKTRKCPGRFMKHLSNSHSRLNNKSFTLYTGNRLLHLSQQRLVDLKLNSIFTNYD